MKKHWSENIKYEYLVAGLSGGVLSTLVLHPFDLIKVRFQVNDGTVIKNRQVYTGVVNAFQTIVKSDGLRGLYQGASANIAASSLSNSLYFCIFNSIKLTTQERLNIEHLKFKDFFIIGCFTGACTLALTNPIWVVKTRMCLQPGLSVAEGGVHYTGVLNGLKQLYKHEGIRGYYRGFVPGLLGVSHGALQFMAYEELKKLYSKYTGKPTSTKLGTLQYITMAALSKVFAVVSTYPYQVVRSRLQDIQLQSKYDGVVDVCRKIYRIEGFVGFYKGMVPSLLRVTPACCITFLVFENISHFLIKNKNKNVT
ncbi:mitochondrial folate transporter/carrier-like isoform X2 [Hydractinia symbiolongicarpus]|uniref:mitochondrial folate transporter/carrier-like isoform X2 n=1 Tax=Hydractinia symbiolongicarpus TaxID=13093 RepID=UPI002550227B|nr:mitochondrial folate transporter/carrier-like isoform X2 [Hydractinia symbiolongicarpus]